MATTHSPRSSNEFIEQQLDERILLLEDEFNADAICLNGPLLFGVDDALRPLVESKHASAPQRSSLVFLITTDGGYIEPVQRAVDLLRRHYDVIDFVIPNYAYSAGTVLALSGDAIHMD
jgi:membrane-bound ClpP family serine protease